MVALLPEDAPPRGTLTVTFKRAEFDAEYVQGVPSTYCALWVLEPTRLRRRRSQIAPKSLTPLWERTFELDDTSAEAHAVIDVWNASPAAEAGVAASEREEEYFGKIMLPVAQLRGSGARAQWHELIQGRIELQLQWAPDGAGAAASAPPAVPSRPQEPASSSYSDDEFEPEEEPARAPPARGAPPPAVPPPAVPPPVFFEYTHRGGDGKGEKENQDTFFSLELGGGCYAWAVFDGHGHDNGRLAAEAARDSMRANLQQPDFVSQLRAAPQRAFDRLFAEANDAVRRVIEAQPGVFVSDEGHLVVRMDADEYCPLGYDIVDGGSTATLAVLLDGRTLLFAMVGDSCAVLASAAHGRVSARELVPEHSALNGAEWAPLEGSGLLCVYEYPEMYEKGHLHVWRHGQRGKDGLPLLDEDSVREVDSYGMGFKTERGDRAAFLLTPESDTFSQMSLAVTRTLGDFYHQEYGVRCVPEVRVLQLAAEQPPSAHAPGDAGCVLLLASDGVWDHWTFDAAMEALVDARSGSTDAERAHAFFEESRAKGEEVFGSTADNLTGIVVVLPRVPDAAEISRL